jgi:pantothenate kinase
MDGFHLTNTELEARGIRHRKGAPPSFDAERFVALLERLRNAPAETVFAPLYSRKRHEPIADALTIGPEVRLVIVEGNYLLLDDPPWDRVAPLLTETWFLDVPVETALERVRARHRRGGCGEREAERKIATNDRPNAELVLAPRGRADRIIKEPG